jgi:hypothetical protein
MQKWRRSNLDVGFASNLMVLQMQVCVMCGV